VPGRGSPTLLHDFLNPINHHKGSGPKFLNNLFRSEFRVPLPDRANANSCGSPTSDVPPDLLVRYGEPLALAEGCNVLPLRSDEHELSEMKERRVQGAAIPDDQELASDRHPQNFQEFNDLLALDGAREEPEVEAPETLPRDHRQRLPREAALQHGRLTSGSPGARATGRSDKYSLATKGETSTTCPNSQVYELPKVANEE
jgi:hypothetical protein